MNKEEMKELYKTMFAEYPDMVTVEEIRKMLRISRAAAYQLIYDGVIIGQKISHKYMVPKISIINYVLKYS